MKNITLSDLEKHFVDLADRGKSSDALFTEFASIVGAKFVRFKYRYPDSYGALISNNMVVNIFNNQYRNTFGFQALRYDGSVEAVLSSQNSDSDITNTIMRLASIIGCFSDDYSDNSDYDESD
jgi:hypothetical protein